jgi:hypothetical protein
MLSFEMKNGLRASIDFMNKLKMCVRTVSWAPLKASFAIPHQ